MATLIRFDWAVKKLLRNKANFDVLEGFLSELLAIDVKIEQILESESNKQHQDDKFNRVDLLVRSEKDELMLIEIQNEAETDYFHRILYGASRLVTEYIKEGDGYASIRKVVSISILYFQLGQGKDYIYEYEGKFVGRTLKDNLYPNAWQKNKFGIQEVADIFPKYYILKVNNFNDVSKNTLDEWMYFLKNSEVPNGYKAKGLKEASEKLKLVQLSDKERREYEYFKETRWIEKDVLETAENIGLEKGLEKGLEQGLQQGLEQGLIKGLKQGLEKGLEQGLEQGMEKKQFEIVKNAILAGTDNELISKITGLSISEIETIRKDLNS